MMSCWSPNKYRARTGELSILAHEAVDAGNGQFPGQIVRYPPRQPHEPTSFCAVSNWLFWAHFLRTGADFDERANLRIVASRAPSPDRIQVLNKSARMDIMQEVCTFNRSFGRLAQEMAGLHI